MREARKLRAIGDLAWERPWLLALLRWKNCGGPWGSADEAALRRAEVEVRRLEITAEIGPWSTAGGFTGGYDGG